MASIVMLSIAIIPMVAMFDTGLRTAVLGGNYDQARALANKQLERVEGLPYVTVRDSFPASGSTPSGGSYVSGSLSDSDFSNFAYTVTKRYKCLSSATTSCVNTTDSSANFADSTTDQGLLEVQVTVTWDGKTYNATGIKAK